MTSEWGGAGRGLRWVGVPHACWAVARTLAALARWARCANRSSHRFVPSLRQLKQQALLLHFPPTLPSRLTQRLQEVREGCPPSAVRPPASQLVPGYGVEVLGQFGLWWWVVPSSDRGPSSGIFGLCFP